MQTFLTSFDMTENARNLDNKRLGKQRVEAVQILNTILGLSEGWKNHPAVKMWKGYERYLFYEYLREIVNEWKYREFKNTLLNIRIEALKFIIDTEKYGEVDTDSVSILFPMWITPELIESHQSNLIRKDYDFYKPKFPNAREGLEYVWPTRIEEK